MGLIDACAEKVGAEHVSQLNLASGACRQHGIDCCSLAVCGE
jgi:hypothetical protein